MTRSHCPHCGQPYDPETPTTAVRCGSCDAAHDLIGRPRDLTRTTFTCEVCGELNILPAESGGAKIVADGGEES